MGQRIPVTMSWVTLRLLAAGFGAGKTLAQCGSPSRLTDRHATSPGLSSITPVAEPEGTEGHGERSLMTVSERLPSGGHQ
jgi:hypothetical protein